MLQAAPETLDLVDGEIVERASGQPRMPLAELARIVYFRGDTLPPDLPRELMQTRHFITKEYPFAFTNPIFIPFTLTGLDAVSPSTWLYTA